MLRLILRTAPPAPLAADSLSPDVLAPLPGRAIARLPVQCGNSAAALGEFFDVAGDASDGNLTLAGDCTRLKWLGAGMSVGCLTVQGRAGLYLGAGMSGGQIEVEGDAGDSLGAGMTGGLIRVNGAAGDLVGGPIAYDGPVMSGGTILIQGPAGSRLGSGMRRGVIAVRGRAGELAGARLLAGTILLFGGCGGRPGVGMRGGTVAIFGSATAPPPGFRECCTDAPTFMALFLRNLRARGFPVAEEFSHGGFVRHAGDLLVFGRGELLYWRRSPEGSG